MTSLGYIVMIIVDSYMIWFHFDCIMQLKKSYDTATNVCKEKVLLLLVISLTVELDQMISYKMDTEIIRNLAVLRALILRSPISTYITWTSRQQAMYMPLAVTD